MMMMMIEDDVQVLLEIQGNVVMGKNGSMVILDNDIAIPLLSAAAAAAGTTYVQVPQTCVTQKAQGFQGEVEMFTLANNNHTTTAPATMTDTYPAIEMEPRPPTPPMPIITQTTSLAPVQSSSSASTSSISPTSSTFSSSFPSFVQHEEEDGYSFSSSNTITENQKNAIKHVMKNYPNYKSIVLYEQVDGTCKIYDFTNAGQSAASNLMTLHYQVEQDGNE